MNPLDLLVYHVHLKSKGLYNISLRYLSIGLNLETFSFAH